jgi:hypothetical protein
MIQQLKTEMAKFSRLNADDSDSDSENQSAYNSSRADPTITDRSHEVTQRSRASSLNNGHYSSGIQEKIFKDNIKDRVDTSIRFIVNDYIKAAKQRKLQQWKHKHLLRAKIDNISKPPPVLEHRNDMTELNLKFGDYAIKADPTLIGVNDLHAMTITTILATPASQLRRTLSVQDMYDEETSIVPKTMKVHELQRRNSIASALDAVSLLDYRRSSTPSEIFSLPLGPIREKSDNNIKDNISINIDVPDVTEMYDYQIIDSPRDLIEQQQKISVNDLDNLKSLGEIYGYVRSEVDMECRKKVNREKSLQKHIQFINGGKINLDPVPIVPRLELKKKKKTKKYKTTSKKVTKASLPQYTTSLDYHVKSSNVSRPGTATSSRATSPSLYNYDSFRSSSRLSASTQSMRSERSSPSRLGPAKSNFVVHSARKRSVSASIDIITQSIRQESELNRTVPPPSDDEDEQWTESRRRLENYKKASDETNNSAPYQSRRNSMMELKRSLQKTTQFPSTFVALSRLNSDDIPKTAKIAAQILMYSSQLANEKTIRERRKSEVSDQNYQSLTDSKFSKGIGRKSPR